MIEGSGKSSVAGREFEWHRGDMFVIPSWNAHSHSAHQDTVLLRVSDEPVMRSFDWYREESLVLSQQG